MKSGKLKRKGEKYLDEQRAFFSFFFIFFVFFLRSSSFEIDEIYLEPTKIPTRKKHFNGVKGVGKNINKLYVLF